MRTGADASPPVVEVVYTRRSYVGWRTDSPQQGGYFVTIPGFPEPGTGRSVQEALGDLAAQLREHVTDWDAEADLYSSARASLDRINQHTEPPLVTWTRARLTEGSLEATLSRSVAQPVLDPTEERELPTAPSGSATGSTIRDPLGGHTRKISRE